VPWSTDMERENVIGRANVVEISEWKHREHFGLL
jgi:hypothetical protein